MSTLTGSYNGISLGTGTSFPILAVEGWDDLAPTKDRDYSKGSDHGDSTAPDLSDSRTITLSLGLLGTSPTNLEELRQAIRQAFPLQSAPLALTIGSELVFAKVRRRGIPKDRSAPWRVANDIALQFYCADPRVYSADETLLTTGLPVVSGGLAFPITFPISFGTTSSSGVLQIHNSGNAPTPLRITYTGALTNPSSVQVETGRKLKMGLTTIAGDSLVLDSRTHEVTLNGTVSRRSYLTTDQWFDAPPGTSNVTFVADAFSGSPTMQIRYRSANI